MDIFSTFNDNNYFVRQGLRKDIDQPLIWTCHVTLDERKCSMHQHVGIAISEMKDWNREHFIQYLIQALNVKPGKDTDEWTIKYTDKSRKTKVDVNDAWKYNCFIKNPIRYRNIPDQIEVTLKRKEVDKNVAVEGEMLSDREKMSNDMKSMKDGIALLAKNMNSLEDKLTSLTDMLDEAATVKTNMDLAVLYEILENIKGSKEQQQRQTTRDAATNTLHQYLPCPTTNIDDTAIGQHISALYTNEKRPYRNAALRKSVFKRLTNMKNMSANSGKVKVSRAERMNEVDADESSSASNDSDTDTDASDVISNAGTLGMSDTNEINELDDVSDHDQTEHIQIISDDSENFNETNDDFSADDHDSSAEDNDSNAEDNDSNAEDHDSNREDHNSNTEYCDSNAEDCDTNIEGYDSNPEDNESNAEDHDSLSDTDWSADGTQFEEEPNVALNSCKQKYDLRGYLSCIKTEVVSSDNTIYPVLNHVTENAWNNLLTLSDDIISFDSDGSLNMPPLISVKECSNGISPLISVKECSNGVPPLISDNESDCTELEQEEEFVFVEKNFRML